MRGRKGRKDRRREGGKEEGGRERGEREGRDGGSEEGWLREWSGFCRGGDTHTYVYMGRFITYMKASTSILTMMTLPTGLMFKRKEGRMRMLICRFPHWSFQV